MQIIFYSNDLKPNTGYEYIYKAYNKRFNVTKKKNNIEYRVYYIIILLPIFYLIYLLNKSLGYFFQNKCSKILIVGSPLCVRLIFDLMNNKSNYYMVDSVYDYYCSRLSDNITKKIILSLCYVLEKFIIKIVSDNILLNSRLATKRFNLRYKLKSKAKKLIIGVRQNKKTNYSKLDTVNIKKIIGIYGNFHFYENKNGLIDIINIINKINNNKNILFEIAGPGSEEFDSINCENIKILGYIKDIELWIDRCDAFILPATNTNGVKIKFLEMLSSNKPTYVISNIIKHIDNKNLLSKSNVYICSNFGEINNFISCIETLNNNSISIYSWDYHFENLKNLC